MTFAFIIWMIFHVGFLVFGLEQQNYAMMMIMYGIRGLAYQCLFIALSYGLHILHQVIN